MKKILYVLTLIRYNNEKNSIHANLDQVEQGKIGINTIFIKLRLFKVSKLHHLKLKYYYLI
jgi:hypothetical protein